MPLLSPLSYVRGLETTQFGGNNVRHDCTTNTVEFAQRCDCFSSFNVFHRTESLPIPSTVVSETINLIERFPKIRMFDFSTLSVVGNRAAKKHRTPVRTQRSLRHVQDTIMSWAVRK